MPADRSPRIATPHSTHDVVLLAAVADRDQDPSTRDTVERMIAACGECAAIADDLRLLAIGLADLPPTLPVPRDMRITEADAARLRRRGLWRSILRLFGAAGLPGLRPLAGAMTALGLVGLLLTNVPLALPGGAAMFDAKGAGTGAAVPAPSAAPALAPTSASNAAGGPEQDAASGAPPASATDYRGITASAVPYATAVPVYGPGDTSSQAGPSVPPLTLISIVLLGGGLGLLALRLLAGRMT